MAEPEDAVVAILRNIQADLGQVRRETSNGFTYTMGLSSQNKVDVEQLQTEIKDIKRRLEELERQT